MNSRKAFFRFEANAVIGQGHLVRCLALAKALRAYQWECHFITYSDPKMISHYIKDEAIATIQENDLKTEADLLVIDHYGLDKRYGEKNRKLAKKILVIDDLANRNHECDFLLDPTYGRHKSDYAQHIHQSTISFIGPFYSLLRRQFVDYKPQSLKFLSLIHI